MPELPAAIKERLQRDYGISSYFSEIICSEFTAPEYFEMSVRLLNDHSQNVNVAHWYSNCA